MIYEKAFSDWTNVKIGLDHKELAVFIRAGEIRWVAIGVNVGGKIDGKGASFTRPCLILHVIGKHLALVLPCTSKDKPQKQFFCEVSAGRFRSSGCLSQIRVVSQKRVLSRIAKLPSNGLDAVRGLVFNFYSKESKK